MLLTTLRSKNQKKSRKASGSDNTITYVFNGFVMGFDNTTEPTILDQVGPGFIESKSCTSKRDTTTIEEKSKHYNVVMLINVLAKQSWKKRLNPWNVLML